jgi:hypothetical protein
MPLAPTGLKAPLKSGLMVALAAFFLAGCASRSGEVKPVAANPKDFALWDCGRIDDELDAVQQRAAEVAYAVDERAGNNILALGVGIGIFWPAILAMRPDGLEATELAQLKGRFEALRTASSAKGCPPPAQELPPARAAALPVALGEKLVYEDRHGARSGVNEWTLLLTALRRDEIEFRLQEAGASTAWRQDPGGNIISAPEGALYWERLLRRDMPLGQVLAGEIRLAGDPQVRGRVRGQVVAVGPQMVAQRRFDVVVIELFGDVQREDASTRLEGAIVVDRASGVLLRLDLRSAEPAFNLQLRLMLF